jgi:hypothetical protein
MPCVAVVDVKDHLRDKPETSVALWHAFVELIRRCGEFSVPPSRSTVTFKGSRRGFAGARPDGRGVVGYLDQQREIHDPRITNVSPYTTRLFVHQFRITSPEQLDDTFAGWVAEAYAVGQGAHLAR